MNSERKVTVTISNRTMLRTLAWIFIAILTYKFVGRITHVLTLIFISVFLSLALNPFVSAISNRLRIKSRGAATAVAYLTVISILVGFMLLVIPPLISQTRDFAATVPGRVEDFKSQESGVADFVRRYDVDDRLNEAAKNFTTHYEEYGETVLNTGRKVAETLVSMLVVLVLTFMMLVEGPKWFRLYLNTLPKIKRDHHSKLATKMFKSVNGFVSGQVILAIIGAVFAFIALDIGSRIFNVDINPLALAGIVAVINIIPLIGNPVSSAIVILVCTLSSPAFGLAMLGYFLVYYFIENHTFQPLLQSRLTELSPLMVLIAALIGVAFGGLLGAILAIPAASAIKILVEDYFERKNKRVDSAKS